MKIPCCSICQLRYNEEDTIPLLLQCGHGFCKSCLSTMFSNSPDCTLSCPRCRNVSVVGNSIHALRKNFSVLALIHTSSNKSSVFDCDFTDEDEDNQDDEFDEEEESKRRRRCSGDCNPSISGRKHVGSPCIELSSHQDLRLLRQMGEGKRVGVETWSAVLGGGLLQCRHRVVVKKFQVCEAEDVVWVQGKLEDLRQSSMWCRNICTFHGAIRMGESLCLVMDRYSGSVKSEMLRSEGRLTLEQILRYGADITRGVAELHAAGIVCMNLKPANFLLDANGKAVVSDYGLPAILKKTLCDKGRSGYNHVELHSCVDCTTLPPHYTAPEVWEPSKRSLNLFWEDATGIPVELDAWSFGCSLVEMCTGSLPWAGLNADEIYRSVVKLRKLPPQYASVVGAGIPRELWKMIGECLQFKPSKRPTFNTMLGIFLHHLKAVLRSPTSPENNFSDCSGTDTMECLSVPDSSLPEYGYNDLHKLVYQGNVFPIRSLLKTWKETNGVSLNTMLKAQNSDGLTALHMACKCGNVEIVENILEYEEASVSILDKDGDPPMVFALASGSAECVRTLIRRGANVECRLREGVGPSFAHVCAYHGHPDCMRELLLAGADPNTVDDAGETVLHLAITKKYTECALVILENGGSRSMAFMNSKNLTPLHISVATWNLTVIKRWVQVATLDEIASGIDVLGASGTALCMASALKKNREPEGREMVSILLAAGADPAAEDPHHERTALHMASVLNDVELVKIMLDAGVDVNLKNSHATIPLHLALARGATSCVGLLLSAGADFNLQDDDGDNAFHIAADSAKMIRENIYWITIMLNYENAAIEMRNHSGKTLRDFMEAIPRQWVSEDLMEALQKKGVHLSSTMFESIQPNGTLVISFCTGEAHVLTNEVIKVIPLDRGQHVQLKTDVTEPRFGWRGHSRENIGTVLCIDDDGILRVGFPGASRGWKADPAEMERVEEFKVGDWVRIRPSLTTAKHGLGSVTPGSIGIVYCIRPDGSLLLELSYLPSPWQCEPEEVEPVDPFKINDRVCVKRSVAEPRYAWGGETHHSIGRIIDIENDGLLVIEIPNRPIPWRADPSDMDTIDDFKVGDWLRVKASVSSPKYGWEDVTRNSIGIIHSLEEDGDVGISFCFRSKLYLCSLTDVEKVAPFETGQEIRVMASVSQPRLGWSSENPCTVGKISTIDMDGTLNMKVAGRHKPWKVSPGDVERLSGLNVGDWVRSKSSVGTRSNYDWNTTGKESLGVVHSVQNSGYVELASCSRKGRWFTHYTDVEKVPCLKVGEVVRFRSGLVEPRWGWRGTNPDSRGIVISVHADGEVRVSFFELPGGVFWHGDPADLEKDEEVGFCVGEWVAMKGDSSWRSVGPGSIGVVHGIYHEQEGSRVSVAFCNEQERWIGPPSLLERVDKLFAGQIVRVKPCVAQPRFGWSGHSRESCAAISTVDADGKLRIFTGGSKPWMLDPCEVEVIMEEEIRVGDWVKVRDSVAMPAHHWGEVNHSSIGVVHRIMNDSEEVAVSFCFLDRLWLARMGEMERVRPFTAGDKVRIKQGLVCPRWGWGMETRHSRGRVLAVDANARLRIQWRDGAQRPWLADPADITLLE